MGGEGQCKYIVTGLIPTYMYLCIPDLQVCIMDGASLVPTPSKNILTNWKKDIARDEIRIGLRTRLGTMYI